MKTSFVYYAALCLPAAMAAAMDSQATAMMAVDDISKKIDGVCPGLPESCVKTVGTLLNDLKGAAKDQDVDKVHSILQKEGGSLKTPECAKPLGDCLKKIKAAAPAGGDLPAGLGN